MKGNSYSERCAELGLATLESRRRDHDMALIYKLLIEEGCSMLTLAGNREDQDEADSRPKGAGRTVRQDRCGEIFLLCGSGGGLERPT